MVEGDGKAACNVITATSGSGADKRVYNYATDRVVGNGSFGVVFQATCLETAETVGSQGVGGSGWLGGRLPYGHAYSSGWTQAAKFVEFCQGASHRNVAARPAAAPWQPCTAASAVAGAGTGSRQQHAASGCCGSVQLAGS